MAVETETQLEAFIAANSGGTLKKIELSELTFSEFENYFAVYADKFKERTAFIDNVLVTLNNITMQVFTKYNDEYDRLEFEYSSMIGGTVDSLTYAYARAQKTGPSFTMAYSQVYTGGAFADANTRALMNAGSTISCDIYTIE